MSSMFVKHVVALWLASVEDAQNTPGRRRANPFPGNVAAALVPAMPNSLSFLLLALVEHMSTDLVDSPAGKLFSPDVFPDIPPTE